MTSCVKISCPITDVLTVRADWSETNQHLLTIKSNRMVLRSLIHGSVINTKEKAVSHRKHWRQYPIFNPISLMERNTDWFKLQLWQSYISIWKQEQVNLLLALCLHVTPHGIASAGMSFLRDLILTNLSHWI